MVVSMTQVRMGLPLPLVPPGSVVVNKAVAICEDDESGMAFIWGIATFCWSRKDSCARRLAALQLAEVGAAQPGEVAAGFGVDYSTFARWREAYRTGGVEALVALKKGPKRPSKLTEELISQILQLRAEGRTIAEVAEATGVSVRSVARVAAHSLVPVPAPSQALVPLARPLPRPAERQAARAGLLSGAPPQFTSGAGLPLAGVLVILPALCATGVVEIFEKTYGKARAAFYSAHSLLLAFVFASALGAGRAERAGRIDPASMGRLLGLDRGPTANTLRRRFQELAELKASVKLWHSLGAHNLERSGLPAGIVYLDGHVRAYNGKADLPKAHLARMRIAMKAQEDAWLTDALGTGLLVWTPAPGAGLVAELRQAVKETRSLLGSETASFTIVFDRGGWSPQLFAELKSQGIDIITYRKNPNELEPASAFVLHKTTDAWGHPEAYLLAERVVDLTYDRGRQVFSCRQITRLDEKSRHQTQIITTRAEPDPLLIATAMFGRWGASENFFRYTRHRFELDGLDSYATIADDPDRLVPNPAKRQAGATLKAARAELAAAEAEQGRQALGQIAPDAEIEHAFAQARSHVVALEQAAREIAAKVPLSSLHPEAARLDPERKRICDAIRISTYNAETILARMLAPHYRRAEDEARTLLQEIYSDPGDIEVVGGRLVVRLEPLSAPHRTRALAALCEELTASETTYPGSELTLAYEVKQR